MTKYPQAAANYTLYNQTFYKCGMPRDDWTHIFRDPTHGDIPWPGAVFGLTTLGLFTWCQDQVFLISAALIFTLDLYARKPVFGVANNKGAYILISAFVIRLLERIISRLDTSEISIF